MVELVVQELDVASAAILRVWNNGANSHSDSEPYIAVTHDDILGALRILTVLVHVLDSYSIIIISDIQSLNQDVLSTWVDSVCVQGVRWQVLPADAICAVVIIFITKQKTVKL